jgi:hypothetical protein
MTKFTFYVDNEIAFQCNLETNRCIAHNKNGTRCKRRVAIGLPYCCVHLPTNLHLKLNLLQFQMLERDYMPLIKQKVIMKLYLKGDKLFVNMEEILLQLKNVIEDIRKIIRHLMEYN